MSDFEPTLSSDGQKIAYTSQGTQSSNPDGDFEVYAMNTLDGSGKPVEIASATAVWYSTGLFAVPIRWVLVHDPRVEFKTQTLLCTDLDTDPQKIVCWFVMRWQLEVIYVGMSRLMVRRLTRS
ncbi:MAG: hypothetical protein M3Q62_14680 [Actinomycetota bacterium]|nr:PD40 domain-containing protein [Rubrobacteraceae bacterium]MDQ3184742.1 hypothetical protein [Actinomycetota bacterium]MDQ3498806.1 hypothetical protein [Actinomycetota bacterium]